jgi:flagellar hook protein FlgE
MEISTQVDGIIADLRRAAVPGAAGNAADRGADVLVDAGAQTRADRFVPSTAPLAVAIDGPGLFVLGEGTRQRFGRLGDFRLDGDGRLVDGAGRFVMGSIIEDGAPRGGLQPIVLPSASRTYADYRIDERGVLSGVVHKAEARTRRSHNVVVPIARVALALFPAPQRLRRADANTFETTADAGTPAMLFPAEGGAGALRAHVVAAGAVDIEADLKELWLLRRKGELDATLAAASDECDRTALGLVR